MAEYIKREDIYQGYFRMTPLEIPNVGVVYPQTRVEEMIGELPATDVAPVLHGRWERIGIKGKGLPIYPCCSVCGVVSAAYRSQWEGLQGPWKYCPNCGAKMDGGGDNG